MRRPFFTGSSLARAMACPASEALPRVTRPQSDEASRGTAIHEFLARVPTMGRTFALTTVPDEHRAVCEALPLDRLPIDPLAFAAEVAFAYDVKSGQARELGRGLTREQAVKLYETCTDHEVPLTLDVVGLTADGAGVFIADYKSGHARQPPAREHAQLLLGALAACRAYKRSSATVQVIQLREYGPPEIDEASLDAFEVDAFADEVWKTAAKVSHARMMVVQGETPEVATGDHCRYCAAFDHCPAMTRLVSATAGDMTVGRLTPETAREAYRKVALYRAALARVSDALAAYAIESNGFEVEPGVVYGPVAAKRETLDGAVARRILAAMHGEDVASAACTWRVTKEGIREALRNVAIKSDQPIAPLERAALEAIRQAGGSEVSTTPSLREYRPKVKK